MQQPTALFRRRPSEQIELAGLWWQITQPPASVGTRLYRRAIALAGGEVLHKVTLRLLNEAMTADEVDKVKLWGADEAIRVLREIEAGRIVSRRDLIDLQLALAPLIPPGSMDKISDLGADLLWHSELRCGRQKGVYSGPDTFGTNRGDGGADARATWERELDAVIPDVPTRTMLEVWAFLLLSRPSSAASGTAR